MTNDESLAKLEEVEKELAQTKDELAQTKHLVDLLTKERAESQRVTSFMMAVIPEIQEKLKTFTPEEIAEREEVTQKRLRKLVADEERASATSRGEEPSGEKK